MRLVLISLDAVFSRDAEFLLSLPHLGALSKQGIFCDRVKTIYPTLTYPIHASIISGCYPDRHGIGHNEPFAPDLPADKRPWHWDAADIQTDTLFTQAARAGRQVATVMWPTTGRSSHIRYNLAEVRALPGENQVMKALRYGSAWWLLKNELKYGKIRNGISQPGLDDYATQTFLSLIDKHRRMPDLMALHLTDCDSARHHHGTFSPEVQEALVRLDERVGRVMQALEEEDALRDTVVAVVSDHGHADIKGCVELNTWFSGNGIKAQAHSLGLGAYVRIHRGDYALVLQALRDNMEDLRLSHVYTREELREMHAPEDVLLAVEPEEGFAIAEDACEQDHLATHGFGLQHEGADCLMWLYGPMFPKGARLDRCNLVDIAPTLARAIHLHLPDAQGQSLDALFI